MTRATMILEIRQLLSAQDYANEGRLYRLCGFSKSRLGFILAGLKNGDNINNLLYEEAIKLCRIG